MPRIRVKSLPRYDLNKSFVTINNKKYFEGSNPENHLIFWQRFSKSAYASVINTGAPNDAISTLSDINRISVSTLVTELSPFARDKIGNLRKTMRFAGNASSFMTFSSSNFVFGDGNPTTNDTAFSAHMWIKSDLGRANLATSSIFTFMTDAGASHILAGIDATGNIDFAFLDGATALDGNPVKIGKAYSPPAGDGWHHLVFTYSGSKTNTGLKFYIDGVEQSGASSNNGSYTTQPVTSLKVLLGSPSYLTLPEEGIFEFAVYSGKVLTASEVSALYDVSSGLSSFTEPARTMLTGSGITSLPVRPYLHSLDNATGSYPTIERWSADNNGKYASYFDDTAAIDFQAKGAALLFQRGGTPFGVEGNVVLGQQLGQESQYLDRLIASPNTSPDLVLSTSQTSILPGISDARVNFTPGQNFKPFVENNLLASDKIGQDSQFWDAGSLPADIGIQGFEQPLWAKTKIEIDINPSESTSIFYSTGTNPHSSPYSSRGLGLNAGINSGITYYNFTRKSFEVIGDLTSGSNIDVYRNDLSLITGSMQAFVNRAETDQRSRFVDASVGSSIKDASPSDGSFIYEKIGGLSSLAGFPQAPKFNATSSQLFDLSDLISTPFVVEKVVYEFSASFPELGVQDRPIKPISGFGSSGEVMDFGPVVYNFFIMNQYAQDWNRKLSYDQISYDDIDATSKFEFDLTTGSIKDVMFTGQVSQLSFGGPSDGTLAGTLSSYQTARWWTDKKYLRDLNIIEEGVGLAKPAFNGGLTGSFVLSGNINQPTFTGIAGVHRGLYQDRTSPTYVDYSMGSRAPNIKTSKELNTFVKSLGGRTNTAAANEGAELSSPRNLVGSVVGKGLSAMPEGYTGILHGQDPGGYNSNSLVPSPYILFPNDKLIFGWANQCFSAQGDSFQSYKGSGVGTAGHPLNGDTERSAHDAQIVIAPGKGKIVLYGSLLRHGKEFHQSTNQLLTSDAIHEDVRSNQNPMGQSDILDQLESHYYFLYTGSYIDRSFGGFDPRSQKSPIERLKIKGNSVISGKAGVTGSILRGVRLPDADERYYDSLVPDPGKIAGINENSFRLAAGGATDFFSRNDSLAFYIMGGTAAGFETGNANPDQIWPRAFPFEGRYGGSDSETAPRTANPLTVIPNKEILGITLSERRQKPTSEFSLMFAQQRPLFGGYLSDNIIAVLAKNLDGIPTAVPDNQTKFLKGFYGFGDGGEFNLPIMTKENSSQTSAFLGFGYTKLNIRGFKYGLINALPSYSSMIYRHDRYGQLRDMLEQRLYTVSQPIEYSSLGQDSLTGLPYTLSEPRGGQRSGPVTINFFKVVGDSPQTAQRVPLTSRGTSSDFADIRSATGGNIRGVWDSRCNIDAFSRVEKPFIDADTDIILPGLENLDFNTQQTDILNALNRGGEVALNLGDFNIT